MILTSAELKCRLKAARVWETVLLLASSLAQVLETAAWPALPGGGMDSAKLGLEWRRVSLVQHFALQAWHPVSRLELVRLWQALAWTSQPVWAELPWPRRWDRRGA
jgi:hypothetical protein